MRKLIEKFKSLGQYFKKDEAGSNNLNAFIKTKQAIYGVVVIFLLIIFMITLHFLAASHHKKTPQINVVSKSPDGILSVDFSQKNSLSALEHQQLQIDGLHKQFHALMHSIIKEKEFKKRNATQVHQQLKKPTLLVQPIPTIQPTQPVKPERALHSILFHYQKTQIRRVEKHSINKSDKNVKTWVPAGTFARAVLLEGADANASVNGQSDTVPILMRFLDQGTLPNGFHSHLKGCFALASIYGDISSERGEARLDKISCTKKDGTIVEKKVQGYITFAGKEGIRGRPVMRNGKILAMAGMSGALSGIGGALQQVAQTHSVSALGATSSVTGNQVWKNGLYGGASTAMGQLAQYYIKRADQYHPIISIGSGTVATVIFQSGFSLSSKPDKNSVQSSVINKQSNTTEIKSLINHAQHISKKHLRNNALFSNVSLMHIGQVFKQGNS